MTKRILFLVASFIFAGCAQVTSTTESSAMPESAARSEFTKFVDDYFDARFRFDPVFGTESGLHQYDSGLGGRSRAAIEGRITELHALLRRLEAIDRGALTFDERIDATALEHEIRGTLVDFETLRIWETNPMVYAYEPGSAIGSLIKRDFAPAAERLRSAIARLRKVPGVFTAARENLANPPREFTDLAIRMSEGSVGYFEGTVAAWGKESAGDDAALRAEFEEANREAIAAGRAFTEWLEKDLLPRSNGVYAIGAETFLAKMKYDEMVEMPLDRLLAQGEAQLQRDYDAFVATAKQIDPSKTPAAVMEALSDQHPAPDALLPSVRDSVDDARRFLIERAIVTVPSEVLPRIEETPPYARSGAFAMMDTPGPYEAKATEAYYYVTPVEEAWDAEHKEQHLRLFNPYVVAIINVHEAYPGHYLQFLYAPRFPTKTRKLVFAASNVEGWAHYAEQMMLEQGFGGGDPRYRLAQLQEALLRDCRYVAGIKLHTEGWTVEQAAKLFEERGLQEPANAYEEARRGAYNPTYLYYTLGKLQIYELRDEYMKKKGATMRQFHDAFVEQGGLPIALIRQILLRD